MTRPTLSVIVPVFNEEETVAECVRALLDQDEPLDEIVVVDNNSTDSSIPAVREIAAGNGVFRIVNATEQGVINARTYGFDQAQGDLLGRVDADTRVSTGWARAVRDFFQAHGDHFAAGSGMCSAHDLPFQGMFRRQQRQISVKTARVLRDDERDSAELGRLFGSNMALTREAWAEVRQAQSSRTDVFEDLDLTLTLQAAGCRIGLIPDADAQISGRRYLSPPMQYLRYCWRDQRTMRAHGHHRAARKAVVRTVLVQIPFYLVMWVPFRAFDPATNSMRVGRLLRGVPHRVLPSGD